MARKAQRTGDPVPEARSAVSATALPDAAQTTSGGRGNCYRTACPARAVLGHVTGRWGGLVLGALIGGTRRYSELRTRIEGISEKMLAQTLRDLEYDGLIERRQYPTVPPKVEYTLTGPGREVAERVHGLIGWLEENVHDLVAARERSARAGLSATQRAPGTS